MVVAAETFACLFGVVLRKKNMMIDGSELGPNIVSFLDGGKHFGHVCSNFNCVLWWLHHFRALHRYWEEMENMGVWCGRGWPWLVELKDVMGAESEMKTSWQEPCLGSA